MSSSNLRVNVSRYLRRLANGRVNRVVTADDIHEYARKNNFKLTSRKAQSLASSVLREPNFISVGESVSTRPVARYRKINEWLAL
jgi:hypothetical protein